MHRTKLAAGSALAAIALGTASTVVWAAHGRDDGPRPASTSTSVFDDTTSTSVDDQGVDTTSTSLDDHDEADDVNDEVTTSTSVDTTTTSVDNDDEADDVDDEATTSTTEEDTTTSTREAHRGPGRDGEDHDNSGPGGEDGHDEDGHGGDDGPGHH